MKLIKIKKTVFNKYLVVETHLQMKQKYHVKEFKHYDYKLSQSISRARSTIFNIVYFNKFEYFFTQTISSKYDRSNLKLLIQKISDYTRQLRKLYPKNDFYYLVIPEYHSDKKCWHLHGFLSSAYKLDSYVNNNGFLSLHHFDKLGWNSISKIKNYQACLKYSGAYITKDLCKDRQVGEKLFYCSSGLKRDNLINSGVSTQIAPIHYDFKNEYVFKTFIDENKYYNLITKLDKQNGFTYYKL